MGGGAGPRFTYFAPQGWQADGDGRRFVVRRWDRSADRLCDLDEGGSANCRKIEVHMGAGHDHAPGVIGTLTAGGSEQMVILKGNVGHFPAEIATLGIALDARGAIEGSGKPTMSGRPAWESMKGSTATVETDQPGGAKAISYGPGGALLEAEGFGAGADAFTVAVGRWSFSGHTLCHQSTPTTAAARCFVPEAWGPGVFRLVPVEPSSQPLVLRTQART